MRAGPLTVDFFERPGWRIPLARHLYPQTHRAPVQPSPRAGQHGLESRSRHRPLPFRLQRRPLEQGCSWFGAL